MKEAIRSLLRRMPRILLSGLGATLGIGTIGYIAETSGTPLILASLGASSVLLFGYPELPFSRAWNVIMGHLLSASIGMAFLTWVGPEWWSMGLAIGMALITMMVTHSVHPPAGSNPLIIFLTHPDWSFIVFPTLTGVLSLWFLAFLFRQSTVFMWGEKKHCRKGPHL